MEKRRAVWSALLLGAAVLTLSLGGKGDSGAAAQQGGSYPLYRPPAGIGWATSDTTPAPAVQQPRPPVAVISKEGFVYRLELDRAIYRAGEPVTVSLSVTNNSPRAVSFLPRRGTGAPVFQVVWRGRSVWTWPASRFLPAQPLREWFAPGLTKVFRTAWNQTDMAGAVLPEGRYTLVAVFPPPEGRARAGRTELRVQFSLRAGAGPAPMTPPTREVHSFLSSDKEVYAPGEPVLLRLTVTNESNQPLTFRSSSSQRFDFVVRADNVEIWRWSRERMFAMMLTSWRIPPGQSVTYEQTWRQVNNNGERVPPGNYTIEGWQIGAPHALAGITVR